MSRWRETLCGSVIKAKTNDAENRHVVNQGPSEVLSCGGAFISRPGHRPLLNLNRPLMVFLPTEKNHVMVHGSHEKWVRYGKDISDRIEEIDVIEEALSAVGAKPAK